MKNVSTRDRLLTLGESDLTVASPAEDIRGWKVLDKAGDELGKVDDLMIDDREAKVRFLQVGAGGFLGLGERHFLIPVDAVTRIDEEAVQVDQTRERIIGAPVYDPDVALEDAYWGDIYGHYGYAPYWSAGYAYPPYPYYR